MGTSSRQWALSVVAAGAALWTGCGSEETETVAPTGTGLGGNGTAGSAAGGSGAHGGSGAAGGAGAGGPCLDVDHDGACLGADCDDENAAVRPGQAESCGNGVDDNCDGAVDEGCLDGSTAYFVDTDSIGGTCADANPGTETAPWCTIGKANATLQAGDTVYLRAGVYAGATIEPAGTGLSDEERITYSAYGDEQATLTGSVYCVRLQDTAYVTILGLAFLDCERNLYITRSDHNNVGYCSFDNPAGPTTWAGSRIHDGSAFNRIYRSSFTRYGAESYYDGSYQDSGCVLDIGNDNEEDASDHNLVTDCTFAYGGHHILGIYADYNVVRNNTFHNEEWYECNRTETGGLCGNRNIILNTSLPDGNVHNVVENNVIAFAGVPPDQTTSTGLSLRTRHNIVRRNVVYECDSAGIGLSADGGNTNDPSHNHIYANVLYRNGYPLIDDWAPTKYGLLLARWVDDSAHNPMTDVAIKNNILRDNQLGGIYYYYVDETAQEVAGNWEEAGDPGFVDVSGTADPLDSNLFDFRLAATSPCIDGGEFLTRTTNAGQQSTALVVEDAGYFTDGYGLVEGDMIQLEGHANAVTVTAVDYAAHTLTVDAPLDWAVGTGVSLPYWGARPDQGAYEHVPE